MKSNNQTERRVLDRSLPDRFYSVEFLLKATGNVYQFKLRDISSQGLGILVREDSEVLQYLKVDQELDMQYNPPRGIEPAANFKTRIRHITAKAPDVAAGHIVIGLEIITPPD